jgi:PAS domain S-box-containing protein
VLDTNLCYVRVNERLAAINGRPVAEHVGRSLREVVPDLADQAEPLFRRVIETGEPATDMELWGTTPVQPNADERIWLQNIYPLRNDGEVIGVNVVVLDITELKRTEESLRQREAQLRTLTRTLEQRVAERTAELERRNQELDDFAYIASHDLKAPLRAIDNLASWIAEDAGQVLPEKSKIHLDKLRGRVKRMEQLLTDLLQYSRADRLPDEIETVDTGALIDDIIDLLSPPSGVVVTAAARMPVLATARVPLEVVLRNLIDNSIKHHHRPEGWVQVSALDKGDVIEFRVEDDGLGISLAFHERVFQMFETLQPRDEIEGSGIGLAVVKKIVESKGGQIGLISAKGQGATFWFTWPKQ